MNKDMPAFPCHPDVDNKLYDGMTLRDYFATHAMQTMTEGRGAANLEQGGYTAVSIMAYKMADAMMKARDI